MAGAEQKDSQWCVYMHKNIINNKLYIGITSKVPEERWGVNGCNYTAKQQPAIYNAIKKYGWDNFEHIIVADMINEGLAKYIEQFLIALYKTNCTKYKKPSYGYNMTDGGDGTCGRVCSDETRQKISKANSNPSEETRMKMSNAAKNRPEEIRQKISRSQKERLSDSQNHPMYNKQHSDEAKRKMSEYARERFSVPENNPFYGKKHTEESKQKMSDSHKNTSNEIRNKMSISAKARCTEEWKQNMSKIKSGKYDGKDNPNAKRVYQYSDKWELIKIWDTSKCIAEEFHVSKSTISGTWLKNTKNEYRGFHWSLLEPDSLFMTQATEVVT